MTHMDLPLHDHDALQPMPPDWEEPTAAPPTWPAPQELPDALPAVPTMTPDMLPEAICDYVIDTAERLGVYPEMVAAPLVTGLGAVLGRRVGVYAKGTDTSWFEFPNLWGGTVGPPSSKKTPTMKEALYGPMRLEDELRQLHEDGATERKVDADLFKAEIDTLNKDMRKKGVVPSTFKAALMDKENALKALDVPEPRLIVNDCSTEKLGELLSQNPQGLLYIRDELVGLLQSTERPGHEGDRPFLLEAWNGKNPYVYDRIGRGTIRIPALTLSIFGGIQPGKLQPYVRGAIAGDNGADGLLQRFQALIWPDRLPSYRLVDRAPNKDAKQRLLALHRACREFDPLTVGAIMDDSGIPCGCIPALADDQVGTGG